jgi:hypothetical protein
VDNARKMIGKTIDISVTSVLQTTAGKMIFGKWDERATGHRDSKVSSTAVSPVAVPPVTASSAPEPIKKPTPAAADRVAE